MSRIQQAIRRAARDRLDLARRRTELEDDILEDIFPSNAKVPVNGNLSSTLSSDEGEVLGPAEDVIDSPTAATPKRRPTLPAKILAAEQKYRSELLGRAKDVTNLPATPLVPASPKAAKIFAAEQKRMSELSGLPKEVSSLPATPQVSVSPEPVAIPPAKIFAAEQRHRLEVQSLSQEVADPLAVPVNSRLVILPPVKLFSSKPKVLGLSEGVTTAAQPTVSSKPKPIPPKMLLVAERNLKPEVLGLSEKVADPPIAPKISGSPRVPSAPPEDLLSSTEVNPKSVSNKCPVCKRVTGVQHIQARGFLEKKILRRILIRPFQCTFCAVRFYDFSLRNRPAPTPSKAQSLSFFLRPEDNKDLRELVQEMSQTEKELDSSKQSPLGVYKKEEQNTGIPRDSKRMPLF